MGELTVQHAFIDDETKINIFTNQGEQIILEKNNPSHTFKSDQVKKIFVTIKKGSGKCLVKCPSSSNFTFKADKEMKVNMKIIGKSGGNYLKIPSPLSMWEFTFNIPVKGEDPDPVTIGDEE